MSGANEENIHPGIYVKKNIIPEGMTVTKAAEILGVGRPALSNFLNGKTALSSDMALRLERAFGADREHILNMQTRFTSRGSNAHRQTVITGTHAPALSKIRACHVKNWANEIQARQELAALLRRLVHSTGQNLTLVDFPAYDNAERHGWDGVVEASTPTPWIPEGKSGWEFGCDQDPKRKAEHDYEMRIKSVPPEERADRTFVFVTPRNWSGKQTWAKEKASRGDWKNVRAYDASDLEQWLEQSAPSQIWFAEQIGLPVEGYRSLEQCWEKWASVCEPVLSPALFDPAFKRFTKDFKNWLENPPDRPFIIAADSRDEALAFISCLVQQVETSGDRHDDRTIVFDTPQALQRFDTSNSTAIIAIIHNPEVEKESGGLHRRCHCIIVQSRNVHNVVNIQPDIDLEPLKAEDFNKALEKMTFLPDEIERLARESACSPTILRRRLSVNPIIKTPDWAGNEETARKLLPAAMVGAWHNASLADRQIMRLLAGANEDNELEINVAALLNLEDPPLWAIGEYRGVASRIDALFAISGFITKTDLENFFLVAKNVLAEKDPKIELPENQQWMAPVYGKVRGHSGALRRGIRETLILLAIYGNDLFLKRPGLDAERKVSGLIVRLLLPFNREKILSHYEDFPDYAEAAPEEFLRLLEEDLQSSEPVVRELMRPAEDVFMGGPRRAELLWALENLAWNPQRFPRVVDVLAKLCLLGESETYDNWTNKPENTLQSLFRFWLPQTAASVDQRIQMLEGLCQRYPELGWAVCIKQLDLRDHAAPNYRPRWRDDAKGAGDFPCKAEQQQFLDKARDLVLSWPQHDETTLGELIERLDDFTPQEQWKIWDTINQWADQTASEDAKAFLRQRIHGCAQVRRLRGDVIAHPERERESSEKLLPRNLLIRHAWLFESHWVELPSDETEDEGLDYEKNEERLRELRLDALREIWEVRGFSGVSALLEKIKAKADIVGGIMREILVNQIERIGFVKTCLHEATGGNEPVYKTCLAGFLWNVDTNFSKALIREIERSLEYKALLILLLCLPYSSSTWRWLDDKPSNYKEDYWKNVNPRLRNNVHRAEEINETIDRLTEVNRAPEAFGAICMMLGKVETSRLTKLLNVLPTFPLEEIHNHVRGDLGYYISKAFDVLDERPGVPDEEKARLEFTCIPWLERGEHGIPNLEKLIAESPGLYAQVVACAFRRNDGEEDPPEFSAGNPEDQKKLASNANHLLRIIKRIPGSDEQGNIDTTALKNWLDQARALSSQYGRAEISDKKIGEFLARGPIGDDNIWPCRPICEGLESVASKNISIGFEIGAWDRRGVYRKATDEDGSQERNLAMRYRTWANKLIYEFPYVSGILENIARSYEDMGGREDIESTLRQRLPFR